MAITKRPCNVDDFIGPPPRLWTFAGPSALTAADKSTISATVSFDFGHPVLSTEDKPFRDSIENSPQMAARYTFASQLKELRFLFCQTGEHSAAVRFVQSHLFFLSFSPWGPD